MTRTLGLVGALLLLAHFLSLAPAHAQAKCLVPPQTEQGKCLQKAGATCNPAVGWVGGNETATRACKAKVGCVRCTVRAAQCGESPTPCNSGGRRDPWVKAKTACGKWYQGCP